MITIADGEASESSGFAQGCFESRGTGTIMDAKSHWESVYSQKAVNQVSWYQRHPKISLELIEKTGIEKPSQIIDIGGGASTLADYLVAGGFENITVLDISSVAIRMARGRLGAGAGSIKWIEADVTEVELPCNYYDVWHDRAVFHFLTLVEDRKKYVEKLKRSLKKGGHVIISTFAPEGPPRCSGLDIVNYSPEALHNELGNDFELIESYRENHITPSGTEQRFIYCYLRRL